MERVSWCEHNSFWYRPSETALCPSLSLSQGREDQHEDKDEGDEPALSEKFVDAYKRVGKLLKTYKSGKLPKTFKIIPYLRNWEEVSRGHAVSDTFSILCALGLLDT